MRALKKGIAIALCAAMVVTVVPAGSADAAKKPSLKKSASVKKGGTTKLTLKNVSKKASVTWKSSKKKVAKVTVNKKAKNKATVKGVKVGKANITATYKGKKYTCKVTVKKAKKSSGSSSATTTTAPTDGAGTGTGTNTAVPTQTPDASAPSGTPTPTVEPTEAPTPTPTPTPSNVPKNKAALSAIGVAEGTSIVIDGESAAKEAWVDVFEPANLLTDETKLGVRGGELKATAATAKLMWDATSLYALVEVTGPSDNASVTVYAADSKDATEIKTATAKVGDAANDSAASVKTDTGYVAELKVPLGTKAVGESALIDIQIAEGDVTANYFDTPYEMEYVNDAWSVKDAGVTADKDVNVLGPVELKAAMEQPTSAYYTDKEKEILEKAAVTKADAVYPEGDTENELYPAAHKMNWIDTTYWTDVYAQAQSPSIVFAHGNVPDYKGNADKVTLFDPATGTSTRDKAQAYTIWSENYLYVLYDVNDTDIAPASADHYDTDSVEFFLSEDNTRAEAYGPDNDAIQIRVDAINGAFTCKNDASEAEDGQSEGTDPYEMIASAVKFKHGEELNDTAEGATGYMVEMIIKFQKAHKADEVLGMDLQINDCFTTDSTTDETTGDVIPSVADRAGTLTAYDTTNNAYQYPNVFGRIELKGAAAEPAE